MNKKFYPYLWYLQYIEKYNISIVDYNPYFEISSDSLNSISNNIYINLPYLKLSSLEFLPNEFTISYIKILSKLRYEFLISPIIYFYEDNYYISKWKYKSIYIKDKIYIFLSCVKDVFKNNIIYFKNNKFLIFLDYEYNIEFKNIMEKILFDFLPIDFKCEYFFKHFLFSDIEELCKLEEWVLL